MVIDGKVNVAGAAGNPECHPPDPCLKTIDCGGKGGCYYRICARLEPKEPKHFYCTAAYFGKEVLDYHAP